MFRIKSRTRKDKDSDWHGVALVNSGFCELIVSGILEVMSPLRKLTHKDITWSDKHESAFIKIKTLRTQITYYNHHKELVLQTGTSSK